MPPTCTAVHNRLLRALPEPVLTRLGPALEPVALALGDVAWDGDQRPGWVYFPTDSVIALIHTVEDGHTVEIGLIGNEGFVGIACILGGGRSPTHAVVQVAGGALRLGVADLQAEFRRGGALQLVLLRYVQALITQVSQAAVCNRLHQLEERLCAWLLSIRDRVFTDHLLMTHDRIAHLLGVRREGVATAAAHLQAAGLIHYARGHIRILDRPGLEAAACECYRVVRDEHTRLLDS
jgi:CRP-like cAMP-binding protein